MHVCLVLHILVCLHVCLATCLPLSVSVCLLRMPFPSFLFTFLHPLLATCQPLSPRGRLMSASTPPPRPTNLTSRCCFRRRRRHHRYRELGPIRPRTEGRRTESDAHFLDVRWALSLCFPITRNAVPVNSTPFEEHASKLKIMIFQYELDCKTRCSFWEEENT